MIKVAIVDDSKMFRDGIKLILDNENDIEIISESKNGKEFINNLNNIEADVVLMDIDMPDMDGIETTKHAVAMKPDLKILTLSMFGEEEYYYKMIHAGVKGFLIKEAKSEELKKAILSVYSGKNYFSQELLKKVIFSFGNMINQNNDIKTSFSKDELEILKLICQGFSDLEIAQKINMEQKTVTKKRNNLFEKSGTSDTANLIMFAIKNEIVSI